MDLFERASRAQLRFDSPVGDLTTEQLWDLPLTARGERTPNLNKLAIEVNRRLKDLGEESFVDVRPNPEKTKLELKLEILKHVIESRQKEAEAATKREETLQRKRKIEEILASKKDQELSAKTTEELEAELAALSTG